MDSGVHFGKPLCPVAPPESGLWVAHGGNPGVAVEEFECDPAIMQRIFGLIQAFWPAPHQEAHQHPVVANVSSSVPGVVPLPASLGQSAHVGPVPSSPGSASLQVELACLCFLHRPSRIRASEPQSTISWHLGRGIMCSLTLLGLPSTPLFTAFP